MRENDLEILYKLFERIAHAFGREFGKPSTLEEFEEKLENLVNYIEKYMSDEKSNNEALQELVDAQLEELSKAYEGLSALFELNRIISSVNEPWMILKNVLKLLDNAVNYSSAVAELEIDNKIYRETVGDKEVIDYLSEQAKNHNETVLVECPSGLGSYVVVPLVSEIGKYGFLALSTYGEKRLLTAGDKKITESVAQQLLTAVNRYVMLEREIEKKRLEEQLQIARRIQLDLLPRTFPFLDTFDIGAESVSATQVGGDYYDIIKSPDGSLIGCVADVSGKGFPAAFIMSSFRSMFRLSVKISGDLKTLAEQFDRMIYDDFEIERFITAVIFKISTDGTMELVNAGHDPLYIFTKNDAIMLESTGTPFGILGNCSYGVTKTILNKGDIVVAYTDGVVEARNMKGEEFGFKRLEEVVLSNKDLKAMDIVDRIVDTAFEFSRGVPRHDDTTVLIVKYR
ncbi:MAG TPA: SpoIIE family protein phosphatase [Fervidobacterium sp.]|nr:SpoIIE family protein phosphatase [Fervidobacterium sp.]HOM73766.1 SpoIIE family protein phosphatase [Fervidobacterium sp.]HOQ40174.1 SpoIIE family protein phosphatase [Fervidobacterium sp.]HPT54692.1 SpoIIE family protein phosphatase [Fervidobacterium sp.]HPZ17980.1 SpoIIE family protein phosphatase [Fervidobacterium sp.]